MFYLQFVHLEFPTCLPVKSARLMNVESIKVSHTSVWSYHIPVQPMPAWSWHPFHTSFIYDSRLLDSRLKAAANGRIMRMVAIMWELLLERSLLPIRYPHCWNFEDFCIVRRWVVSRELLPRYFPLRFPDYLLLISRTDIGINVGVEETACNCIHFHNFHARCCGVSLSAGTAVLIKMYSLCNCHSVWSEAVADVDSGKRLLPRRHRHGLGPGIGIGTQNCLRRFRCIDTWKLAFAIPVHRFFEGS